MRNSIYALLAAILHLGNINFTMDSECFAQIDENDTSKHNIRCIADLLNMNPKDLEQVLLQRTVTVPNNQKDSVSYVK